MAAYEHKIGATLDLVGQLTLDGQVQDMSGWSARCTMRGPAGAIALDCAWADASTGVLAIGATPVEQEEWQPGRYSTDVRLESPAGVVLISSSAQIVLLRPETL
ncbi:MAG TPA: hypothetical protein PLN31_09600 [Azoarcus taiwanensis]|nr:hypothetical protein [Azoarcus taiwanensis]